MLEVSIPMKVTLSLENSYYLFLRTERRNLQGTGPVLEVPTDLRTGWLVFYLGSLFTENGVV